MTVAGPLYGYSAYYPPIQQANLSSGREYGVRNESLEPGEVFDMLLRKECEKNSRKIQTPSLATGYNQFNFMRAGSTLAIVAPQLSLDAAPPAESAAAPDAAFPPVVGNQVEDPGCLEP